MTIRNVLLLFAAAFFAVAFFVLSDGCMGYLGEGADRACIDPSGVGQIVSQAAHLLFAGLVILSVALLDHDALLGRGRSAADEPNGRGSRGLRSDHGERLPEGDGL